MPWYAIVLLVCLVIGPFDALYLYIKSERRREAQRRRQAGGDRAPRDGAAEREREEDGA